MSMAKAGETQGTTATTAKAQLQAWKDTAQKESAAATDRATQQAVKKLENTMKDAQPQFREQAESAARDERQAMDNAALYAELRGDRGGIGKEQYSAIQNTAAANRLSVQQMQTKLATDTARQIEELRTQGEFEKADNALKITQSYLAELTEMERWSAEHGLSADKFQASLEQWAAEHALNQEKADTSREQWEAEFGLSEEKFMQAVRQWTAEYDLERDKQEKSQEQWEAEFGLSEEKFAEALKQWAAEHALDQEKFEESKDQWEAEFGLSEEKFAEALKQWAAEHALNQEKFEEALKQWAAEYALDQEKFEESKDQWEEEMELAWEKLLWG